MSKENKTKSKTVKPAVDAEKQAPDNQSQKPKNSLKTTKRLLKYFSPSIWPLLLVFASLIASVIVSLMSSYMMRDIINNFLYSGATDFAGLLNAILRLISLYLISVVINYLQSIIMLQLAQRGTNRLRKDMFDRLQQLPLSYFDKHPHGELMSRFTNDADNVQQIGQSFVSLFSNSFMFVGLVVLMVFINWKLFIVSIVMLIITFLAFLVLGSRSRLHFKQQQAALGAVNGEIQEVIEGLKVVKAFTHEKKAQKKFNDLDEDYRIASSKAGYYSSSIMPISSNMMNISYAVTAAIGAYLSVIQGFDLGGLVVYLNYSRQVGQMLSNLAQQMNSIFSALAGAERIFEVMDTEPEIDEGKIRLVPVRKDKDGGIQLYDVDVKKGNFAWQVPKTGSIKPVPVLMTQAGIEELKQPKPGSMWAWKYLDDNGVETLTPLAGELLDKGDFWYAEVRGVVKFENVDFSYVEDTPVLKDITLEAKQGQKIAFVGSTGAGKTTITNLINRFYEIDNGKITFDGLNIKDIKKADLRQTMGSVLQDTSLFTGTIMDNIRYGRLDATDEECIAAAKSANAHSFIRRLPDGYNTEILSDGGNLSQGQRQLLAIARAAVATPTVMILDEATSSIDTRTERHIDKGMNVLMLDRTVFVIAHRLSTVRNADSIVVIEDGQLIEMGSHQELLEQKGRYYCLYTGQFQLT